MNKSFDKWIVGLLLLALVAFPPAGAQAATPAVPWPTGVIADQTPTYSWDDVGAEKYQVQLKKGTTLIYKFTLDPTLEPDACNGSVCENTPTKNLSTGKYKWRVRAMVGGVWGSFSPYKTFTVGVVPVLKSPTGQIENRYPDYVWGHIQDVEKYHLQVWNGTTLILEDDVSTAACDTTTGLCTFNFGFGIGLPPTNKYKWRVRATFEGVDKPYSAYKTFAEVYWPDAGKWDNGYYIQRFTVPTSRRYVKNFTVGITVNGCGSYNITHSSAKVSMSKFAFTGSFYANGKFSNEQHAAGKYGFNNFYIAGCGYISGSMPWSTYWYSSLSLMPVTEGIFTGIVASETGFDAAAVASQQRQGITVEKLGTTAP
jgi:hypothetical protein